MQVRSALAAVLCVVLTPVGVASAKAATPPPCTPAPSLDGNEPPCNPWLAQSTFAQNHGQSYNQDSVAVAGPRPGDRIYHDRVGLPGFGFGSVLAAFFSPTYADGRRVVWALGVPGHNDNPVYKVDPDSHRVIDRYSHTVDEREPPTEGAAASGIYILITWDNRIIHPRGDRIEVYGDAWPSSRRSKVRRLKVYVLPDRARCGPDDQVVGQAMLYDGRFAFVTKHGMLGVLPSEHALMDDDHLEVASLNGTKCSGASVEPPDDIETVSNALAADEHGGLYPVTDHAQYRYAATPGALERTWRVAYQRGTQSTARQDAGSGSTPTLMGTKPEDDKFVVITDGRALMHLVLLWRDEIPADWPGLPGRDRRIACEVPVRFGDATRTTSASEQSVVVRGYASFLPNNQLRNADLLGPIIGATGELGNVPFDLVASAFLAQSGRFAPRGFERIDWDPATRTCATKWANKDVSIPNGVPVMSAGSNMVYGVGVRHGTWGMVGMNAETGRVDLWVPGSRDPNENSFFSEATIGSDGTFWSGAFWGLVSYGATRVHNGPALP